MAASTVPGPRNATRIFHPALQVYPGAVAAFPTYDLQHTSTSTAKLLTAGLNITVGIRPPLAAFSPARFERKDEA